MCLVFFTTSLMFFCNKAQCKNYVVNNAIARDSFTVKTLVKMRGKHVCCNKMHVSD